MTNDARTSAYVDREIILTDAEPKPRAPRSSDFKDGMVIGSRDGTQYLVDRHGRNTSMTVRRLTPKLTGKERRQARREARAAQLELEAEQRRLDAGGPIDWAAEDRKVREELGR